MSEISLFVMFCSYSVMWQYPSNNQMLIKPRPAENTEILKDILMLKLTISSSSKPRQKECSGSLGAKPLIGLAHMPVKVTLKITR